MKELRNEIMDYLLTIPKMNKQLVIAILNPLKTEKQLEKMKEHLANNYQDKELMRRDKLLNLSLQISKEN